MQNILPALPTPCHSSEGREAVECVAMVCELVYLRGCACVCVRVCVLQVAAGSQGGYNS